jgi:site-specific recombinase XerD
MAIQLVSGGAPSPLESLVYDYLSNVRARGVSPRTDKQYRYALEAVFLPWCAREGITDVGALSRRVVDRFTSSLHDRHTKDGVPISKHSVHTYLRPVRLMLTWASREGEDVKAKPQLPRRPRPIRDVLSRDEIDRLEGALPTERDRLIIRVFGDCGLRLDELARLTSGDIVRSGRQAHFRVRGKGGHMRDVPVGPHLLRRLDRHMTTRPAERSSDAIFISFRRAPAGHFDALTDGGVYQVVKDAVVRAGISKRVHPHLLRHSWMTEMLRQSMNPVQLSFIAGASIEVIMQHYAHLTKDDAYEATLRALSGGEYRRTETRR